MSKKYLAIIRGPYRDEVEEFVTIEQAEAFIRAEEGFHEYKGSGFVTEVVQEYSREAVDTVEQGTLYKLLPIKK